MACCPPNVECAGARRHEGASKITAVMATTTTMTTTTTTADGSRSGGASGTTVTATQNGMSIGFGARRWDFTAASLAAGDHAALPIDKLARGPLPEGREPVVVVSCGSFSPPTLMHLRICEDAKDQLEATGKYVVVGGYLSPTHAAYGKASLVDMHHRLNMCKVGTHGIPQLPASRPARQRCRGVPRVSPVHRAGTRE